MTSPSDFQDGERVWEAFAYLDAKGMPVARVRRGTFGRTTDQRPLFRCDDGRADVVYETYALKVFRTYQDAVEHCARIFYGLAERLREAVRELSSLEEPGDPAAASVSAAGTAPPEVAL